MDEFPTGYFYIKARKSGKVIDGKEGKQSVTFYSLILRS